MKSKEVRLGQIAPCFTLRLGIWLDQATVESDCAIREYRKPKDVTVTSVADDDHLLS
jgi:hypothetical protein